MKTLVECVANFSEGRDLKVLDAIVTAIRSAEAVQVLDLQMDVDHHEQVRREAKKHGVEITGSQLVGLVPRKALEAAASHYLEIEDFESDDVLENRLERSVEDEGLG